MPDRATQILMTRFYDNLWRKNMSKLDALREAQRWMLDEASKQLGDLRGLSLPNEEPDNQWPTGRLPPRYWAAFVLSGEWR